MRTLASMNALLPLLVLAGALAAVLGCLTWLAVHVRRRGTAGAGISAALASYDEAFRATAHESHHEIQAQARRKDPLPAPDGHWKGRAERAAGQAADGGRSLRSRPRRRGRRAPRRLVDRLRRGR